MILFFIYYGTSTHSSNRDKHFHILVYSYLLYDNNFTDIIPFTNIKIEYQISTPRDRCVSLVLFLVFFEGKQFIIIFWWNCCWNLKISVEYEIPIESFTLPELHTLTYLNSKMPEDCLFQQSKEAQQAIHMESFSTVAALSKHGNVTLS